MPSEDSIQRYRPLALEVLKARGSARRSSAAMAAVTGAALAGGSSANPSGPATLVPQVCDTAGIAFALTLTLFRVG